MWKRIFGKKRRTTSVSTTVVTSTKTETKIGDLEENIPKKVYIVNNMSIDHKNHKMVFTDNSAVETKATGSNTIVIPEVIEMGNQTISSDSTDNSIQTEGEPPSEFTVRSDCGNQTETSENGRGEVLQVGNTQPGFSWLVKLNPNLETGIMSYETPAESFRNYPIVSPAELLHALQELAKQQDASGDC